MTIWMVLVNLKIIKWVRNEKRVEGEMRTPEITPKSIDYDWTEHKNWRKSSKKRINEEQQKDDETRLQNLRL